MPAPALLVLLALAGAACPRARACSSFVVDCGDGAVVHARTVDFEVDMVPGLSIQYRPAGSYRGTPLARGGAAPTYNFTRSYVALEIGELIVGDGLNDAGLAIAMLYQSDMPFHHKYNASGPGTAVPLTDLSAYILGTFSSVAQVRKFLDPGKLQITTDLQDPEVAAAMWAPFADDPDIPRPDADGTLYLSQHYQITDATGDSVLLEATPGGGFDVYDTQVVTNEPAWPAVLEQREAYLRYNFSDVPGLAGQPKPDVKPWLIPFNSADDTAETGYIGSLSRNMRTWLQLQDCAAHPWPNGTWSPAGEDASARPPPGSFKALKRAENFLGAIVVPMSQLNGAWETYATQAILLADSTDLTYYWRTIQNNGYQSLRLADLAGKGRMTWAIGPTDTPFAQDAAGKGTPMD